LDRLKYGEYEQGRIRGEEERMSRDEENNKLYSIISFLSFVCSEQAHIGTMLIGRLVFW
jgi:hypothetical protein